jgi:hypothetical protein
MVADDLLLLIVVTTGFTCKPAWILKARIEWASRPTRSQLKADSGARSGAVRAKLHRVERLRTPWRRRAGGDVIICSVTRHRLTCLAA